VTAGHCPGCDAQPGRQGMFCGACWSEVPTKARTKVADAWKAYKKRPGSRQLLADYENAISAAAANVTTGGRR
jgi:hypothetical protein